MKYAAIEIGTNSTKMIIVQRNESDSCSILRKSNTVNRLSRCMFENRMIQSEALKDGMNIIHEYMKDIKENNAELVSVFSTSVLRDADNRNLIIQEVKRQYGCDIQIISGEQEAFYAYRAASRLMRHNDEKAIVIDIGGGSTEIICGNKEKIDHKVSLDIGAVRLTELYCKNDPATDMELNQITCNIGEKLKVLPCTAHRDAILIGTGGTIKTLATIYSGLDYRNEKRIDGMVVPRHSINNIFHDLVKMNLEARKKVKGLNPKRADVIVAGLLILQAVIEAFGADQITISSSGVIEGYMDYYIFQNN